MASLRELVWLLLTVVLLCLRNGAVSVRADATVTGTVFCDQCKDGEHSFFVDYPLSGAKVAVECGAGGGYGEDTTNWFGSYAVRFEGNPELSGCAVRVVGGSGACAAAAGPARAPRLVFRMFGMALYTVEPLLSQPSQPTSFCPNRGPPASPPAVVVAPRPPPPLVPVLPPPVTLPRPPPLVPVLPPPVTLPRPPSMPFVEASACPFNKWMMPQFKCYWNLVRPDTKVALAFGPLAAAKYGTDMTLWDGLHGRGDLYRTLLREGTTALLNSYHSLNFFYPSLSVINHMNLALLGTPGDALMIAVRFRRVNSGATSQGHVGCNFSPCS